VSTETLPVDNGSDQYGDREDTIAQRRRRKLIAERARRDALAMNVIPLDQFGISPSFRATTKEAAVMFGVSTSSFHQLLQRNEAEMNAAGWDPATNTVGAQTMVRLAMIMRAQTSELAARIQRAVDPDSHQVQLIFGGDASHATRCRDLLATVNEMIEDAQDIAPDSMWARVRELDDYTRNAVLVALLWMVPDDTSGTLKRVKLLDPNYRTHPAGGSVAEGFTQIIPTRETAADGKSLSDLFEIDDEVVGL
jgi:hypothetical protein